VFAVEPVHVDRVVEDQRDEDEDRPLLREPESEIRAADRDARSSGRSRMPNPSETSAQITRLMRMMRTFAAQYSPLSTPI
jgi:hypothetical protein